MTTIVYIAPSAGETHHPQARIYTYQGEPIAPAKVRNHYRQRPDLWLESGLINYQGRLVCFDGEEGHLCDLVDAQPLAAGSTFFYED